MAAETKGRPTLPVWVGNLKETVSEDDLKKLFSRHGSVASCKVMRDKKTGKSRLFGYVNFYSRTEAENAASKLSGRLIHGAVIRTAGPAELERKGHFSPEKDFRPLIDCSFFIQGNKCKKGDSCPFRHSKQALSTRAVCPLWVNKQCTNMHCPMRHPGGMERKSESSEGSPPPAESQVYQCGGRCGNLTCTLSFSSNSTLMQHIRHGQLQCTYCKVVFGSESELRGHKKMCSHRSDSMSTDTPSPSLSDVEILSDSESTASEDMSQLPPLNHSPVKSGAGAKGGRRRGRRKRSSSGSATNAVRVTGPTKSFSETGMSAKWPSGMPETRSHSAVYNEPLGTQLDDGSDGFEGVSFGNWSDSSESSDEEDLTYTSAEMARLLSLNEQDMYPHMESEEEEEEEGEGEGEGERENFHEDDRVNDRVGLGEGGGGRQREHEGEVVAEKKQKARQRGKKKETNIPGATNDAIPTGAHPHPSHFGQPEPVGLFWDIENCSVPPNKSAFAIAAKMRKVFFEGKREAEFMVVCDITKEKKEVTDALHKAQVTLVHVSSVAKNAADDKLRQSLRRFAHTYPAPSTVVLVSGDVNFSSELNDLRYVHKLSIVLVHGRFTSDALKVFAHTLVDYEQFLEDVGAPKEAVRPPLPNIVLVSNLPHHIPPKKLQNRLQQLSDNCGGRVLGVDPASGTGRILFRTPEWAMKAEKRIKGEDVFGSKIATCLDYSAPLHPPHKHHQPSQPPPPPFPQPHAPVSQLEFRRLSGTALDRTYPPTAMRPSNHPPMQPSPPPPRSAHPFRPPLHPPPSQPFPPHGPLPPPSFAPHRMPPPSTRPPPQMQPPLFASPPSPPTPPHLFSNPSSPFSPSFRSPPPRPPFIHQPGPTPYSQVAATPAPRPEGKILIFKIPPTEERTYEALDRQILTVVLGACVKAEHLILWHSYSEMQVLLKLDFHKTAIVRNEEIVKLLWEKGDLRPKAAGAFVEQCVKSLADLCKKERLPWQVTACGWTEDEEADRITRSQVIGLLRCYSLLWVKWNRFQKKYNENYQSAISEMSIHTACKGAVQILGKQDQDQSQVIIFHEMSPLIRIAASRKACSTVVKGVVKMLSSRPQQKIRLLDLVKAYTSECGPLPLSASGKTLQEILSDAPNLQFVGSKPSSICLTLVNSVQERRPSKRNTAGNIDQIATEFRHLLKKQAPNCELPLNRLQQEYQTLYHHSFRVSDYIPGEGSKMRDLVEACQGLKLKDVRLPNNRPGTIVYLESEQRRNSDATPQTTPEIVKRKVHVGDRAAELPTDTVKDCEYRVRELLCSLPDYQITLDRFLPEYEKKYGKMTGYYGHSKLSGLLESFTDTLELGESRGPSRLIKLRPVHILTYELTFLLSAHSGSLPINQIVPTYKQTFGRNFLVTDYGFPKLIRALEALPEHIQLVGTGPSRVARLKKLTNRGTGSVTPPFPANRQQFVDEVTAMLMSKYNLKMSIPELTKMYNVAFRQPSNLPPVSTSQLVEALTNLPGFSLTGAGPAQYVQLAQEKEKEKKEQKKLKTSPKPQREEPSPLPPPPSPLKQPPPQGDTETRAAKNRTLVTQIPQLEPAMVPMPATVAQGTVEGTRLDEKEMQRLCSETHRLLLCHQEHAMTVSELEACFKAADDPAQPNPEELYHCLKKQNSKKKKTFQFSEIPGSVGDSMIQLNRADCLWKLGQDLLYLFVYRPTPELALPTVHLLTLYEQCYGHKFVPAIYGVKSLEGVIETVKTISKLMTLDENKRVCSLTEFGCRSVMSTLLAELLFLRGDECLITDTDLPRLFQEHFSIPLHLSPLKVDSPSAMLSLPEIQNVVQAPYGRPELKSVHRFAEQLRQLLTQNNGRLPLDSLQGLYIASFGSPTDVDIHARGWLNKKLIHCAPHVVNLSGQKWAVWAPTGRPYPPRGGKVVPPLPMAQEWPLDCETGLRRQPQRANIESSLEEDREKREKGEGGEREGEGRREGTGEEEGKGVGGIEGVYTEAVFNGPAAQQTTSEALALGKSPEDAYQWESSTTAFGDLPRELPLPPPGGSTHALGGRLHTADQEITDPLSPVNQAFNSGTQAPLLTSQEVDTPQPQSQGLPRPHPRPRPRPPPSHDAPPTSSSSTVALDDEDDGSPFGFLRKEPQLLSELTVKEEDIDNAISTVEALQKLLEAGSSAHTIELANLPPPVPPAVQSSPEEDVTPQKTDPETQERPVDYLEAGMSPNEVLQELYRVKDSSGGIINPANMEPFLDYFGELSRRELERLESQQSKLKSSTTPSKGVSRKKRMMAIRFPGQPQDPFPYTTDPELRKTLEAVQRKLPVVPDSSDSSDSDTCPKPVTRAELLKQLMEKKYFSSDEEDEQEKEMASKEASISLLHPPVDPIGSRAVSTAQAPGPSDQSRPSSDLPVLTGYGQEPHSQY